MPPTRWNRGSPPRNAILGLFVAVNLLNYIDRQMLFAVFPLIQKDFALSDTALGLLGSAFMVSYLATAPLFGWFGDRMRRVRLAASGFVLWSLASAASGLAGGYRTLLATRSLVGVGEASFGTVSPSLLTDYFPDKKPGHILSFLYLAIPVGSALGYLLGGVLGARFGWKLAFVIVGTGGILLAIPLWYLPEPLRGGFKKDPSGASVHAGGGGYASLLVNRPFILNTLAMTAMTFAMGGLAQWMPTFLFRVHGMTVARGNTLFGGLTVVAGITGTLVGGLLGEAAKERRAGGQLLLSGAGFLAGIPVAAYALTTPSLSRCLAATFVAELFLFLNTAPLNATTLEVTPPAIRSMAFAVNIFVIHALGDALSPTLLGWLSDRWGLRNALLMTPAALVPAAIFCFLCARQIRMEART